MVVAALREAMITETRTCGRLWIWVGLYKSLTMVNPARHYSFLQASLLFLFALIQIRTSAIETEIYDEAGHITAGYSALVTGDFRISPDHPPLARYLCALPLLFFKPDLRTDDPAWKYEQDQLFEQKFLYENRVPARTIIEFGRLGTILMAVVLGYVISAWTRHHFGPAAAILGLTLYCFDPIMLSHGHYITTDLAAGLTYLLACLAWDRYLDQPLRKNLFLAGAALGAALLCKFSTLILLFVLPALAVMKLRSVRGIVRPVAMLFGIAFLVVWAGYRFEARPLLSEPHVAAYYDHAIGAKTKFDSRIHWMAANVPLPAFSYWRGLYRMRELHVTTLRPSYLLGMHGTSWWYYFPVAFAVKTPTGILLLSGVMAVLLARRIWKDRAFGARWFVLLAPPAIYLAIAMSQHVNMGIRHILPLYPFLYILIGAVLLETVERRWVVVSAVALAMVVAECAYVSPHFLAFFNALSGGPAQGPRYLADSSIDWGQDLLNLKSYLERKRIPEVCLDYAGFANVAYYGVPAMGVPPLNTEAQVRDANCAVAVSVSHLRKKEGVYDGLVGREPDARIGWSIYVYDLRRDRAAVLRPLWP